MQLERILHSQGFGTRRECRELIRLGRVEIGGAACSDPFAEFPVPGIEFSVDQVCWQVQLPAYLMLHKPTGVECSRQPRHHPSVFSLLPMPLARRGVQPVGRLDEDTSGLLLLSDDGAFIHALSSPRRKVAKVYEVETRHPVGAAQVSALLAGVTLHDAPTPVIATACELLAERQLRLTITAGSYHQVKRMIAAVGNRVDRLKRTAIGELALPPDLPPGAWRWLTADELAGFAGKS